MPRLPGVPDVGLDELDVSLRSARIEPCVFALETDGACGDAEHNTYLATLVLDVNTAYLNEYRCVSTSPVEPTEHCE